MSLKIFHNALFATAILLLAGCSDQYEPNIEPNQNEERVELIVATELPFETEVQTRSAFSDVAIANCDAIVFDETGKLLEVVRCGAGQPEEDEAGNQTGRVRINILLAKTDKRRTIQLVANARYPGSSEYRVNMTHLREKVTTEAEAMANMTTYPITDSRSYDSQTSPVIMWSRIVLPVGIPDNRIYNTATDLGIAAADKSPKFLRSEAMINVTLDDPTDENNLGDLQIISMCPYNFQDRGLVTPAAYTTAPTTTPTSARPTGSVSTVFPVMNNDEWWMPFSPRSFFFAYERNCTSSDYMTIILKANYQGVLGYYKLVLMQNATTPFNIIRNHKYNILIKSVGGPGYTDLQTCLNGKPGNALNIQIIDQDANYCNSASDANFRLSVDCNQFELYRNSTADNTHSIQNLVIANVYTNRTTGSPTVVQDPASATWLRFPSLTSIGGGTYELIGEFVATDNVEHRTTLTVKFDNLETDFDVIWHPSGTAVADENSYVVTFPREGESNWALQMTSPIPFNYAQCFISKVESSPSVFDGVNAFDFGLTEVNSRYAANAYYHLKRESGFVSKCKYTATNENNEPINATLVFYQE